MMNVARNVVRFGVSVIEGFPLSMKYARGNRGRLNRSRGLNGISHYPIIVENLNVNDNAPLGVTFVGIDTTSIAA